MKHVYHTYIKPKVIAFISFIKTTLESVAPKINTFYHRMDKTFGHDTNTPKTFLNHQKKPQKIIQVTFWLIAGFVTLFFILASFFYIDAFVYAEAKIDPSSEIQKLSHLEGGIIEKIFVKEGQFVHKNDPLIKLKKGPIVTSFNENQYNYFLNLGHLLRLKAQAKGDQNFQLPTEISDYSPKIASEVMSAFANNQRSFANEHMIIAQQLQQKKDELKELEVRKNDIAEGMKLVEEELKLNEGLLAKGLVIKSRVIEYKKELNTKKTDYHTTLNNIEKAKSAILEMDERLKQLTESYRSKDFDEIANRENQVNLLKIKIAIDKDHLDRSIIEAPCNGFVQNIDNQTIGSAIQGEKECLSILPVGEQLIVTAQVMPQDIGFISKGTGQTARVKVSAYDSSIYGDLEGVVEDISPDTFVDHNNKPYYKVKIRTKSNALYHQGHPYFIEPGMTASVNIFTGKRTIMQYICKPIIKTFSTALRER